MSAFRRRFRPIRFILATLILLVACSPPPAIYSRNPVDADGTPFADQALIGLELKDHTRYELDEGETLQIEGGVLVIRSKVRSDGSRRQRAFDLDKVELLKVRHADGDQGWYPVATPADLIEFGSLPRLSRITLVDGEVIEVTRETEVDWSASRLEILVGPDGSPIADRRILPLEEIESVHVADTSPLKSTLLSPKFWIVVGAAAALGWFLAGQENSDNTAVE
jgi:hypothetical protein